MTIDLEAAQRYLLDVESRLGETLHRTPELSCDRDRYPTTAFRNRS